MTKSLAKKIKDGEVQVTGSFNGGKEVDVSKMFDGKSQMEVVKEELTCQTSIKKAKITKDRTLEVTYTEHFSDGGYITVNKACEYLVHEDLLEAFKKLVPHLVTLTETKELEILKGGHHKDVEDYDMEGIEHISVKGFTIGGNGDTEGVVLFGIKAGSYGSVNLMTPFLQWDSPVYPFTTDLINALSVCKGEVMEYLSGKHAHKQLEMEFDETAEGITEE